MSVTALIVWLLPMALVIGPVLVVVIKEHQRETEHQRDLRKIDGT